MTQRLGSKPVRGTQDSEPSEQGQSPESSKPSQSDAGLSDQTSLRSEEQLPKKSPSGTILGPSAADAAPVERVPADKMPAQRVATGSKRPAAQHAPRHQQGDAVRSEGGVEKPSGFVPKSASAQEIPGLKKKRRKRIAVPMLTLRGVEAAPPPVRGTDALRAGRVVGGLVSASLLHVGIPLGYAIVASILGGISSTQAETPQNVDEIEVVEARFVQLGEPLDPRQLPDRQVPIKETAPTDAVVVSEDADQNEAPEEPEKKEEEPPKDATEDLLRRLGDRAQAFAEIAERRKREGSPDGIEDGTAKEARAGDVYVGRLYMFFRRGWSVPTLLSDAEKKALVAKVSVGIGTDLRVSSVRITQESGNPLFDQSILDHINGIKGAGTPIPPPPEEVASQYVGRSIALRFHGKDAR